MKTKKITITQKEEKALRNLKEELNRKFHLIDFKIFGSRVKGAKNSESDIDVMIEINNSSYEVESTIDDIIYEINLENDSFISAIIFTKEELINGQMSESPLYKAILRDGVQF